MVKKRRRGQREERERRRELVRAMLAKGMKAFEIREALEKEGVLPEGEGNLALVRKDLQAIRREDMRSEPDEVKRARKEYIRGLEEVLKMASSGEKRDLKVAIMALRGIAEAKGVRPDDVKITAENVAKMPKWLEVMQQCATKDIKEALQQFDLKKAGKA